MSQGNQPFPEQNRTLPVQSLQRTVAISVNNPNQIPLPRKPGSLTAQFQELATDLIRLIDNPQSNDVLNMIMTLAVKSQSSISYLDIHGVRREILRPYPFPQRGFIPDNLGKSHGITANISGSSFNLSGIGENNGILLLPKDSDCNLPVELVNKFTQLLREGDFFITTVSNNPDHNGSQPNFMEVKIEPKSVTSEVVPKSVLQGQSPFVELEMAIYRQLKANTGINVNKLITQKGISIYELGQQPGPFMPDKEGIGEGMWPILDFDLSDLTPMNEEELQKILSLIYNPFNIDSRTAHLLFVAPNK